MSRAANQYNIQSLRSLRPLRALFLVAIALYVEAGCGLFEPRDPEPPVSVRSTFTPPTEPAIVLTNMAAAFRELNSVNFLRCLSDTSTAGIYAFDPTPAAAGRYGAFTGWSRLDEGQWFTNARSHLSSGSAMTLTFSAPVTQSVQPDSVQMDVPYDLTLPHGQAAIPQHVVGRALFTIAIDHKSGFWSIRRWRDIATAGSGEAWSDIKGGFAQ